MGEFKLLDCTLRDGGYINDWNFGYENIVNIVEKLAQSQIDYVEIGFLKNCVYNPDKTVFNNTAQIKKILPKHSTKTKFLAMTLHNTYDIDQLEPYDGNTIAALRVTFHDYDIDEGLLFIKKAILKGYKVFCNPINIMGYSDEQVLDLIRKINEIEPYAFSIVDTFGSMMKEDLTRIYSLIENNLNKNIVLGLHLHENLSLSYALAQDFIHMCSAGRNCVIDSSLLGMGRVPGNLCLELIMDYMNKTLSKSYHLNHVLDVIDDYIIPIKEVTPWGYATAYALSAKYNLHRNYAEYLLDKGKLRAKQINQILAEITNNKKTAFDEEYIENLYVQYQAKQVDDAKIISRLREDLQNKEILILAPGSSIKEYEKEVKDFISTKNPIVISANFEAKGYQPDYIFFSNIKRFEDYMMKDGSGNIIITSNLTNSSYTSDNIVDYSDLAYSEIGIFDNCGIMLLKLLVKLQIKTVYLAGFDGYQENKPNYIEKNMRSKHQANRVENKKIAKYLDEIERSLNIQFITPSLYKDELLSNEKIV